ncbi:acetyl-CoA carboxylase carboxyltransferase subunit alpha [Sutterella sp.]|uniref:acetyl-CoA carboxylase carboxyltransferase subunit alpha n=1 Tax=Sutterella sp. TaxID=1981025 RepID=UPI0025D179F0|nr:acetyl-CoA carboxylase carboxyltransferase subunit alpha [uncultured Sutterella sp.]
MAKKVFLEFERDIEALEKKIDELRELNETESKSGVSVVSEIASLEQKEDELVKKIYASLTPWQCSLVARHPQRPYTLDYIDAIFTDFHELHGDRAFADDQAIVGGLARLADINVVVIGHQKGRTLRERTQRNFGMAKPEGYRKALRLMQLAEKFDLPVVTFVDTPGAYPGIDAEERGQSEAIGRNLFEMAGLKVPVITCVIGEGGSGGALAIAVADVVMMLQYSTYSVISPEGCASILWKDAAEAPRAAEALALTADRLSQLGLVDRVISEPLGGAHRDPQLMAVNLKQALIDELRGLLKFPMNDLLERRAERMRGYGFFDLAESAPAEADPNAVVDLEELPIKPSSR